MRTFHDMCATAQSITERAFDNRHSPQTTLIHYDFDIEGLTENMLMNFSPFGLFLWLITAVVIVIPFWSIFSKAGHSKWLSLLMVLPVINIIMLYFLAPYWPDKTGSGVLRHRAPD